MHGEWLTAQCHFSIITGPVMTITHHKTRGHYNTTPSFSYNLFTLLPSGEHSDLYRCEQSSCSPQAVNLHQ